LLRAVSDCCPIESPLAKSIVTLSGSDPPGTPSDYWGSGFFNSIFFPLKPFN